jgi:sialate O-acetylesterase
MSRWRRWEDEKPAAEKEYKAALASYDKAARDANESGKAISIKKPQQPRSLYCLERPFRKPSAIFNAMVAPVIPYGIKGVIWYQGESNKDTAGGYQHLFASLIRDWRQRWKQGEYPFLFVQLAAFRSKEDPDGRARVQDAQRRTLEVSNTGMAVALDVGELENLHPLKKKPIGERLALCAFAKAYGSRDVVFSGPLYKAMKVEGDKIRLSFDNCGSGLIFRTNDSAACNFTVAGVDREFHAARAAIDGQSVLVSADAVKVPVAVRYCWTAGDEATLFNAEGLPAALFRTDEW